MINVKHLARGLAIALLFGGAARAASVANDFDGDGKADLGVYYADAGAWYFHQSADNSYLQMVWGWASARPVLGDFDGDGKADLAVFNKDSGIWYIRQSSNGALSQQTFGYADGRPVPADYDGDGKTDLAIFQHLTGNWYILQSSNGQVRQLNFGWSETRPVPADFDGDGKADVCVFHRATGNWYILFSGDGSLGVYNWGWSQARPVPADYDGDGKADLAVYNLTSGDWYIRRSSDSSLYKQNWGWISARPVPSDFDGDGKTDLAVYHRDTGNWYILQSSSGTLMQQNWGWVSAGALPSYRDGGIQGLIILAFGDSITYGTASSSNGPETGYPILLEEKAEPALGGHFVTVNGGDPGEQTDEGRLRIYSWLDYFKPDLTLIMEGPNDEFFKVPYSQTEANLRAMVAAAQSRGSDAIIGTIPPVIKSSTRDRTAQEQLIEGFNPRIYSIAADMGIRVAKVWEAITAVPGWQTKLIDQETANHPNDAGYLVVRDAFFAPLQGGTLAGEYY